MNEVLIRNSSNKNVIIRIGSRIRLKLSLMKQKLFIAVILLVLVLLVIYLHVVKQRQLNKKILMESYLKNIDQMNLDVDNMEIMGSQVKDDIVNIKKELNMSNSFLKIIKRFHDSNSVANDSNLIDY